MKRNVTKRRRAEADWGGRESLGENLVLRVVLPRILLATVFAGSGLACWAYRRIRVSNDLSSGGRKSNGQPRTPVEGTCRGF